MDNADGDDDDEDDDAPVAPDDEDDDAPVAPDDDPELEEEELDDPWSQAVRTKTVNAASDKRQR